MSTCKALLLSAFVTLGTLFSPIPAQASDDFWALDKFLSFEQDAHAAQSDAPNPFAFVLDEPIWDEFVDWAEDRLPHVRGELLLSLGQRDEEAFDAWFNPILAFLDLLEQEAPASVDSPAVYNEPQPEPEPPAVDFQLRVVPAPTVASPAPAVASNFGNRLCPDPNPFVSLFGDGRDFSEYQELQYVLWWKQHGCLHPDTWKSYQAFREQSRSHYPFFKDAFGHWNDSLEKHSLYLGVFNSGSYSLPPPTVGDLVEFEIFIGWMELMTGITPMFMTAEGDGPGGFIPVKYRKGPQDTPLGNRYLYLATLNPEKNTVAEALGGLVMLKNEAPIEHYEAFKAWLNRGDRILTHAEISKAGGSKLWGIPAGSALDNFYRGTQGEMGYGGEASVWTVYGAAYSGAQEGAQGGASIYFNTMTFGATDGLGLTDSTQYQGSAFASARVISTVTREAIIIAGTGGMGASVTAGRAAVYTQRAIQAVDRGRDLVDLTRGAQRLADGDKAGATDMLLSGLGLASSTKLLNRAGDAKQVDEVPGAVKPHSPSTPKTGSPGGAPRYNGVIIPDTVCFVAGTEIAVRNGTKPIEQIKVGDRVWAFDEKTGRIQLQRVSRIFKKSSREICEITVQDEVIKATPEHPFWVCGIGWIPAGELKLGAKLANFHGGTRQVTSVTRSHLNTVVFNFEVEGLHTYFVSSLKILVHNKCRITPLDEKIVYKERKLSRAMIDKKKPFNQALSDEQPILGIRAPDGSLHIMEGNHRVRAAVEQGIEIEMNVFTPEQWIKNFGIEPSTFNTLTPKIVP